MVEGSREAAIAVFRIVQGKAFPEELDVMIRGSPIRSSPVRSLEPYLDSNGLIRSGGSLPRASICRDQKTSSCYPLATLLPNSLCRG